MEQKSNCEEDFCDQEQQQILIQLRSKIKISHLQLHQLVNDANKLTCHVAHLITTSKTKVDIHEKLELNEGLTYLKESQRILQYAANSGKNIPRSLIITTLHNQASIYLVLWQLKSCSGYLEGVIYNYETFIKNVELTESEDSSISEQEKVKINHRLSRYNIQHCAINSQLGNHQIALSSVQNSLNYMQEVIIKSMEEIKIQLQRQTDNDPEKVHLKVNLLRGIILLDKKIQEKVQNQTFQKSLLKSAHFSIQMWTQTCALKQDYNNSIGEQYPDYLKSYSIGNIVEVVPIELNEVICGPGSNSKMEQKQYNIYAKAIMLSVGFFSKATELRLKAVELFRKNIEQRKFCRQYKLSVSYHLLSIITVCIFVPYDLKYLQQILGSYEKHYHCNLMQYKTVEVQSIKKIVQLLEIEILEFHISATSNNSSKEADTTTQYNDYNLKTKFEEKVKKTQQNNKIKTLKKITKQLTSPNKYSDEINKSKESKNSLYLSRNNTKNNSLSKHLTMRKSPTYKQVSRQFDKKEDKNIKKVHTKKLQKDPALLTKGKRSKSKNFVDETEELFFCFSKKTKKLNGIKSINSKLTDRSKSSKKSVLSPKANKVKPKDYKSPKNKVSGQQIYF